MGVQCSLRDKFASDFISFMNVMSPLINLLNANKCTNSPLEDNENKVSGYCSRL